MARRFSKDVYKHPDRPGEGAKKRKGLMPKDKVHAVMGEFKRGTLRMGRTGKKVPADRPDIAKAIAMSEAGLSRRQKKSAQGSGPMSDSEMKAGYRVIEHCDMPDEHKDRMKKQHDYRDMHKTMMEEEY